MAALDRKLLLQAEGVQADCPARRQNRSELRRHDLHRRRRHQLTMNPNRPYSDHAAESGLPVPDEPVLFMKATSAICGPYDNVEIPRGSEKTDWEVELGIVIGRPAKYVSYGIRLIRPGCLAWATSGS